MSDYPEHDKLAALRGANDTVGDFIEWLRQTGREIGDWKRVCWNQNHRGLLNEPAAKVCRECGSDRNLGEARLCPSLASIEDLIAQNFGIDQRALEAEKQQMLRAARAGR